MLSSRKRRQAIPGGTREAALRDIDQPALAVRRIIRDAYNHGQAVAYSGADAPVLVQQIHRDYLRILADAPIGETDAPGGLGVPAGEQASGRVNLHLSDVTGQLLEILGELDIHARDRGDVDSLDRFIHGQGRKDLMLWMGRICTLLKQTHPRELNGLLIDQLRSDLGAARFSNIMEGLLHRKDESTLTVVGMASTMLGLSTDPAGVATLMGVAASVYPLGKGLMRQLGYAPSGFTGPQWPFLYTYGTLAKRKQLKQLRYVLDELHRREV